MSSSEFSAELRPDRRLRALVLATGAMLALVGAAALATLPWPGTARLLAGGLWVLGAGAELLRLGRVYRRFTAYRVYENGQVALLAAHGVRRTGVLAPGSVVSGRIAWLRIRAGGGPAWAELLAGERRESQQWRRFHVIFRHLDPC